MKLPKAARRDYSTLWRCHRCATWNDEDLETCIGCGHARPILPHEAKPRKQLIRMLETMLAYAEDHGMNNFTPWILRAAIIAYTTETEGHLAALCRAFVGIHMRYRGEKKS